MLKFFRRIRQRLLKEERISRYLLYAAGEIALVVIGILIALKLNNWNELRKKEQEFRTSLEQVYNSIEKDVDTEEFNLHYVTHQLELISQILNSSMIIQKAYLPHLLYYVNLEPGLYNQSESPFHLSQMKQFPGRSRENELTKQISNYVNNFTNIGVEKGRINYLGPALIEAQIPEPMLVFGLSVLGDFEALNPDFYDENERAAAREIVLDPLFRARLKSLASRKERLIFFSREQIKDALSVQEIIREYEPDVKLLYEEVGILGTALHGYDDVPGVISTPMELTDARNGIWEARVQLKEGTVKFRTRNSWNENWGGTSFPKGKALFYGENIPVKPGNYRVILNLKENTYQFLAAAK